MKTLYEITQEQRGLIALIEESDGLLTPEIEQALVIGKQELEKKSLAYLEVISQKEQFITAIDTEIKRLQALKKQSDGIVSKLKENLLNAVITFGEFEVGTHKFSIRKSEGTICEDVNSLPKDFKVITITEKPDLKKIKEHLKSGGVLHACYIEERDNLSIK